MKKFFLQLSFAILFFGLLITPTLAQEGGTSLKLAAIFNDHAVFQRDKPIPVWGWSQPGQMIAVTFGKETALTETDKEGHWMVKLPPQKAGGPYTLSVVGESVVEVTDILVGEVWVCSGQSNMGMSVRGSLNAQKEMADANYPQLRLFRAELAVAGKPQKNTRGSWFVCSPKTVGSFSGAAYFFGRELHQTLKVPVGLIQSAWGGTRIEPWITKAALEQSAKLKALVPSLSRFEKVARQVPRGGRQSAAFRLRQRPTMLYNAMIHPLIPYGIRGAIWYQGESNVGDGGGYCEKMKALIEGWRKAWDQGDFPFYYVQIAPFWAYGKRKPGNYSKLCDDQRRALSIPNTGMAVTSDIGDLKDIHPKNKQAVGKRLALWALAKTYGEKDLVYSGPLFKGATVEVDKIRISFDYTSKGLTTRDGKDPNWFEVAGKDGVFHPAQAKIEGQTVVIQSDKVKEPLTVRFGWHCEAIPNLMNQEKLPASCFMSGK